jgi:hypothetical protein
MKKTHNGTTRKTMKPKIRQLQKFANPYFRRGKCPLVRWKANVMSNKLEVGKETVAI